jgi:hypothetical protein
VVELECIGLSEIGCVVELECIGLSEIGCVVELECSEIRTKCH